MKMRALHAGSILMLHIVENNLECFQLLTKKINPATAKPQAALREDDKVIWGNKTRIKSIRKRLTHVLERDSTKWD